MTDYAVLGIINLLLAISEDSATLRSDMSAVYGVWQESDVVSIALFFRCTVLGGRRGLRLRGEFVLPGGKNGLDIFQSAFADKKFRGYPQFY